MLTRQQIIKTIRNMHRRKEPLNITAVKRYHPELMKAVYAIKPYWGWKKALEAAGIKYSDIEMELLDYCECEICHARETMLMSHITKKHGIEMEDYRMDYPEVDLICEEIRARRSIMKNKEMPHWEPLWTMEYALDRLWARYEKGLPINYKKIFRNEPSLIGTLAYCFKIRDTTLSLYDMVLGKLGLNPEDIRLLPYSLKDKKEALNAIVKRWEHNLPLDLSTLKKSKDSVLLYGAIRMFGSWRKAIEAAGLDYNLISKNPLKYPTRKSLLQEIQRRQKAKLPLNTKALDQSDCTLCIMGRKFFGSWRKAIEAAGICYEDVAGSSAPPRKYPTHEAAIAEIQRRHKAGLPLNVKAIARGGGNVTLYRTGCEYFGSWKKAINAAGIRYKDVKLVGGPQQKYPTAEAVIEEIQRRQKEGMSICYGDVMKGSYSDRPLCDGAKRHIGKWAKAVKRAGVSCQVPLK